MSKFYVVSSQGRIMSEMYDNREDAQAYATELNVDFPDCCFWVVEEN